MTSERRSAAVPDIPTFREMGLPAISYSEWWGLFAPKTTPKDVIGKLNAAAVEALADAGWISISGNLFAISPGFLKPALASYGNSGISIELLVLLMPSQHDQVTMRALLRRINRQLRIVGDTNGGARQIRRGRGQDAGGFYILDVDRNEVVAWGIDPEDTGRRMGLLGASQAVEP